MKKVIFGIMFFVMLVSVVYAQIPNKRVAVIESVVVSGNYSGNIERHLAARIETGLQNSGWITLARGTKYNDLIAEQNLQGIDPATQPQKNKIWGSTALIKAYAEINISETPQYNSFYINGWGSSSSRTTYVIRCVLNLQTINSTTGQTSPNVITEKILTQSLTTNSNFNTPYGSVNGGGYVGDVREVLGKAVMDVVADEAVQKLNAQYFQVPGQNQELPKSSEELKNCNPGMGNSQPIFPKKSDYDLVIYSSKGELIELLTPDWRRYIRVTSQDGIVRISNLGNGVKFILKSGINRKRGITPCEIKL